MSLYQKIINELKASGGEVLDNERLIAKAIAVVSKYNTDKVVAELRTLVEGSPPPGGDGTRVSRVQGFLEGLQAVDEN